MAAAEEKLEMDNIRKVVRAMDRPSLLKLLNLKFNQPVVGDIEDL